ncbi:MAG: hypothetical protein LUF04_01970 [Bacteroides sp.]|nr:hypothetical protein [Bacteroides sp.]
MQKTCKVSVYNNGGDMPEWTKRWSKQRPFYPGETALAYGTFVGGLPDGQMDERAVRVRGS